MINESKFPQWLIDLSTITLNSENALWASWVRDPDKDACDVSSVRCLNERDFQYILSKAIVRHLTQDTNAGLKMCREWPDKKRSWQEQHQRIDLAFFERETLKWEHDPKYLVEVKHGRPGEDFNARCQKDLNKLSQFLLHSRSRGFLLTIVWCKEDENFEPLTNHAALSERTFSLQNKGHEKIVISLFESKANAKAMAGVR